MKRLMVWLTPVVLLATGACATAADVKLLRTDIAELRTERTHADSVHRAELSRVISALGLVNDSMAVVGGRLARYQGDVRGELYAMGQQLIQIQELTGQSQRRLQEMRASLDQRAQEVGVAVSAAPGDTAAATRAEAPGPNQLFQLSLDQLRRGSAGTARAGFEALLHQHPKSDVAPDAQYYIGEAYAAEGNAAASDSAFMLVVATYPQSPRAPTALYKHALFLETSGNVAGARTVLQQVVQRYPRSDAAGLAADRLRTLK